MDHDNFANRPGRLARPGWSAHVAKRSFHGRPGLRLMSPGAVTCGQQQRAVSTAVARALSQAMAGSQNASRTACRVLRSLIGRGIGLTPSGDDFVGGLMVALNAAGCCVLRDQVRDAVIAFAETETNMISHAHLACASQGIAAEPIHNLIDAVLQGHVHALAPIGGDIDRLGHTSGWDIVCGAACALEAIADRAADAS